MRWLTCFAATMGILVLAAVGGAQGTKKQPSKVALTKSMYMVSGLH